MTEVVPDDFWQGVAQFNSGDYYTCHDTLEALWMDATEPQKTFYQGILQIAVALYHLSNKNWRGAVILLGEGTNRLGYYQPDYAEINVEKLIAESRELLKALQGAGEENVGEFAESIKNTATYLLDGQSFAVPIIAKIV
ncbi:DUF309 domain-containing protein [Aerosakkonemataceae cyanobacterium BLCC-F154]|uniref:DUF309 domain-containing protein n=1 Tax=Floridaenema fluviatile BLCC-F154 TaxID=3153640 RepID=A0ABV4YFJ4_9CYAN